MPYKPFPEYSNLSYSCDQQFSTAGLLGPTVFFLYHEVTVQTYSTMLKFILQKFKTYTLIKSLFCHNHCMNKISYKISTYINKQNLNGEANCQI